MEGTGLLLSQVISIGKIIREMSKSVAYKKGEK
jgi:hypothetical protein